MRSPLVIVLLVGMSGCPLQKTDTCAQDAECVPDPSRSEPRTCVKGAAAPKRDSTTPFDEGFQCGCVGARCQLVAGPNLKREIDDAVRKFTASRFPTCKDSNIRVIELRTLEASKGRVFMDCHCGDDCGHACEFDIERVGRAWSVVEKDYSCATR